MKNSWKIARVAGIGIYVHVTFPLLLIWIAFTEYQKSSPLGVFLNDVIFIGALFTIVVLHELGHALTARRYGIKTHDITLLPIGGVAHLERMPDNPRQELAIAVAGPAVNVALAAALFGVIFIVSGQPAWSAPNIFVGSFLERLLWANVAMAVFNLMPAFPMDGGRVLRALLALRLNYARATTIAARIGRTLAVFVGVMGLFTNPFLVLIAVFVWMGAEQEAGIIRLKSSLADVPVGRIAISRFETLTPAMPIEKALERVLSSYQPVFPVMEHDVLCGMVGRSDVLSSIARSERPVFVQEIMRPTVRTAEASEKVGDVLTRLPENELSVLPVFDAGRMVGLLMLNNIIEYLHLHDSRHRDPRGKTADYGSATANAHEKKNVAA